MDLYYAEKSLIGAILIDDQCFPNIAKIVKDNDFLLDASRSIFLAAQSLHLDGKPIDPVLVGKWLEDHGEKAACDYMKTAMLETPSAANAEHYAGIVAEASRKRKLRELAQNILDDEETATDEILEKASRAIHDIVTEETKNGVISSDEAIRSFWDSMRDREMGNRNIVPSGFMSMDNVLGGGFLKSGLYIIAARPAMGKTTLALNIADNIKGGVLFVSLEMSKDQLSAKRLARRSLISSNRLLMGDTFEESEYARLYDCSKQLEKSGMAINSKMGATVPQISVMAHAVKNLSAIVVDYLGLIQPTNAKLGRYEATTEISGALKRLAVNLNIPVIALAQLNRGAENRDSKRPRLSDLRDSGSIEQDADGVILLYRDDYYSDEKKEPNKPSMVEVEIAKNRHGSTGKIYLNGYLAYSYMEEMT